jgi:hypothetical protein
MDTAVAFVFVKEFIQFKILVNFYIKKKTQQYKPWRKSHGIILMPTVTYQRTAIYYATGNLKKKRSEVSQRTFQGIELALW